MQRPGYIVPEVANEARTQVSRAAIYNLHENSPFHEPARENITDAANVLPLDNGKACLRS